MKQIAIIGPTASGKSDFAIKKAKEMDAYILSLDSLSIYKDIDIVSAKPSKQELLEVRHFGIDEIYVNEYFSVELFIGLYKKVKDICKKDGKNLIIVGGTSFYLKSLLDGLSKLPKITKELTLHVKQELRDLKKCYEKLYDIDKVYMSKISPNDKYRIEKAMLIFKSSKMAPSQYFKQNPPQPIIKDIEIYNISLPREILRKKIEQRTHKMYEMGLIDEICYLEQKYTREPNAMKSIGIVEVLAYLDGYISKDEMLTKIIQNTARLAKRQETFNKNQFSSYNLIQIKP